MQVKDSVDYMEAIDEQLLFIQVQEGNEEAYKRMFHHFYSPLCEYASQYIEDVESEELVQEFMVFIWEKRKTIVISKSFRSYLFTAIKNRCLNAIRSSRYKERVHSILYDQLKDQFEDPDYYFINELTEKIHRAIDELPGKQKEVFLLSRFGEKTNTQIAMELEISVKTVEYHITQSLKNLRIKLKDYLPIINFILHL